MKTLCIWQCCGLVTYGIHFHRIALKVMILFWELWRGDRLCRCNISSKLIHWLSSFRLSSANFRFWVYTPTILLCFKLLIGGKIIAEVAALILVLYVFHLFFRLLLVTRKLVFYRKWLMKPWWKLIGVLGFQSRWWSFLRYVCSYLESLFHGDSYSILGSTLFFQLWKCLKKCLLLKAKFEGLRVKCMSWSWSLRSLHNALLPVSTFLILEIIKMDPGLQLWSHWCWAWGEKSFPF